MKFEVNDKRKSHRINIPIKVIIDNATYFVKDWSASGLKVEYPPADIEIGDEISISIILPTGGSAIILDSKAIVRNEYQGYYGVEFKDMDDKNNRVLRHYATLAIEGNINHVDDISSDLFMTNIQTPIKEPILLTDNEDKDIHKVFWKKVFYYILFAMLFIVIVIYTLLYNYIIIYEDNGIVAGNDINYKAPYNGKIKDIFVEEDQEVYEGQLFFEMDTKNERELLSSLIKEKNSLKKILDSNRLILHNIEEKLQKKKDDIKEVTEHESQRLKLQFDLKSQNYEKAKYLYSNQLITYPKFRNIESDFKIFLIRYNSTIEQKYTNESKVKLMQEILKMNDHALTSRNIINGIENSIQKNMIAILTVQQKINNAIVLSRGRGTVYNIANNNGDEVRFSKDIVTIENDEKPYIIAKVTSKKASFIHIDGKTLIYSSRLNRLINARVQSLGDGDASNKLKIKDSEVAVKIMINADIEVHLNEYLRVYFLNDSTLAKIIIDILPEWMMFR